MSTGFKIIVAGLMSIALLFGFLHLFFPDIEYNFERLHVFLFNLCCGGTIILYYTEAKKQISGKVMLFLTLAILYAILAFFEIYIPAILVSIILAGIVESVRIKHFSVFPSAFFKKSEVSLKFHQASLLCLSMGLIISSLVILNNEYLKLVSMKKLELDTFFLGFSFPVSLITMSVMFSLMDQGNGKLAYWFKEVGFWNVNLGVIIFFLFIIFEKLLPQVFITLVLFLTVAMIFILYRKLGKELQQKNFLTSGMTFLLVTAVTGVIYVLFQLTSGYSPEKYKWLLKLHAFAALYGWNLCGLAIILRYHDFPIRLHSKSIIAMHWIIVILLAPFGNYNPMLAIMATVSYAVMLYFVLFSKGTGNI
ncbi:MAG: hypothetical protein JRF40_06105 [Deltaproteobacteria bacterium]|nr:hypothetical protein [Deltaproteobacteria bacterium]MBW2219046.1 hypothetical protein [Deltaproteobacteria bacterium]